MPTFSAKLPRKVPRLSPSEGSGDVEWYTLKNKLCTAFNFSRLLRHTITALGNFSTPFYGNEVQKFKVKPFKPFIGRQ
jgi:hypothetical protein